MNAAPANVSTSLPVSAATYWNRCKSSSDTPVLPSRSVSFDAASNDDAANSYSFSPARSMSELIENAAVSLASDSDMNPAFSPACCVSFATLPVSSASWRMPGETSTPMRCALSSAADSDAYTLRASASVRFDAPPICSIARAVNVASAMILSPEYARVSRSSESPTCLFVRSKSPSFASAFDT